MVIEWRGRGLNEEGVDRQSGRVRVKVDPRYFRPTEVDTLLGDPRKAREKLGWVARTGIETLVAEMVRADLREAEKDRLCQREGFRTFSELCETRLPEDLGKVRIGTRDILTRIDLVEYWNKFRRRDGGTP